MELHRVWIQQYWIRAASPMHMIFVLTHHFLKPYKPAVPVPHSVPTCQAQLCCRSGKGAGESMVPFVPMGEECCTGGVGKEAEECVFCWMLDLDRTPVSIYLLHKLTICSWSTITFILLANISSPTTEEKFVKRFYLIHRRSCCFFHLSGNSGSDVTPLWGKKKKLEWL